MSLERALSHTSPASTSKGAAPPKVAPNYHQVGLFIAAGSLTLGVFVQYYNVASTMLHLVAGSGFRFEVEHL